MPLSIPGIRSLTTLYAMVVRGVDGHFQMILNDYVSPGMPHSALALSCATRPPGTAAYSTVTMVPLYMHAHSKQGCL